MWHQNLGLGKYWKLFWATLKHRCFFLRDIPIILNERALEPTMNAAGQWRTSCVFQLCLWDPFSNNNGNNRILHIRFYCACVRNLPVWYLWRMPKLDAPRALTRALVFRPLVKGNEALGTRLACLQLVSCLPEIKGGAGKLKFISQWAWLLSPVVSEICNVPAVWIGENHSEGIDTFDMGVQSVQCSARLEG